MRDRIPTPGKANRVRITQDDGAVVEGVLSYADDATQEGSAYTKGNVLPDDVCSLLGIDPDTSEPKDAWLGVIAAMGYAILTIAVTQVDGTPLSGFVISGIPNVITEKLTTDSNGKVYLIIPEGEYSLTIPTAETIDSTYGTKAITAVAGQAQSVTWQATSKGTSRTFSSSQSGLKFSSAVDTVDVFCCGGGGGGGGSSYSSTSSSGGGGGGGGGYTKTSEGVAFTPWSPFNVTVGGGGIGGAGGAGPSSENGRTGGTSRALGVSASGGYGGKSWSIDVGGDNRSYGGRGGSGGGGGHLYGGSGNTGDDGGSDGSDGGGRGGEGQGTTTRSMLGTLCSGGGGGGGYYIGKPGKGSVGRGGNGGEGAYGSSESDMKGKNGSAGRVELRWTFKQ